MADETIEVKNKKGRPPLSAEEKEARVIEQNKKSAAAHKESGYAAQQKYRETHPEKYDNYEPKIRIASEFRGTLSKLLSKTGLSITNLFIGAVEEKYNVKLRKD